MHILVQQLPNPNTRMLEMLLSHFTNIVVKNLMIIAYLGGCFGKAVNEVFIILYILYFILYFIFSTIFRESISLVVVGATRPNFIIYENILLNGRLNAVSPFCLSFVDSSVSRPLLRPEEETVSSRTGCRCCAPS